MNEWSQNFGTTWTQFVPLELNLVIQINIHAHLYPQMLYFSMLLNLDRLGRFGRKNWEPVMRAVWLHPLSRFWKNLAKIVWPSRFAREPIDSYGLNGLEKQIFQE